MIETLSITFESPTGYATDAQSLESDEKSAYRNLVIKALVLGQNTQAIFYDNENVPNL